MPPIRSRKPWIMWEKERIDQGLSSWDLQGVYPWTLAFVEELKQSERFWVNFDHKLWKKEREKLSKDPATHRYSAEQFIDYAPLLEERGASSEDNIRNSRNTLQIGFNAAVHNTQASQDVANAVATPPLAPNENKSKGTLGNPSVDVVTPTPTTAEGGLSTGIKKLKVLPAPLAQRDSAFDMPSVTNVAPVAQDTHAKASVYGDLIDYTDDEHKTLPDDATEDDTSEGEESESGKSADEESLTGTAIARSPFGAGPIRGDYTAHGGHRSGGRTLLSIPKEARQSTLPHQFIFFAFTQTHNRLFVRIQNSSLDLLLTPLENVVAKFRFIETQRPRRPRQQSRIRTDDLIGDGEQRRERSRSPLPQPTNDVGARPRAGPPLADSTHDVGKGVNAGHQAPRRLRSSFIRSKCPSSCDRSPPACLLFVRAVSRPGKKWVYEDDGKEAHRSFIRVAREAGSGPLNLGHEIQKRAVVNQLFGDLVKRLLTFQVEAASSEQVPFVLIAAVCYRNESTPVRIRLFTCRGVEFPPHYKATYNGSDWEIGAVGHTYFMLHVQSNIQVTKITPHMHNIITGRVSGTHKHVVGDGKRHRLPRNEEDHLVVAKRRRAE
ncbi:hypothetical protein CCUS01_04991 [Colletotrichum cuscutae]|uniref:Uncharacterized protein n=1 Tax=Colletotrichum cuscutae TaxID=1209917 RepID=A0AAI9Y5Z4_9PEZI|nr:hypothetical protein CCUS01_04991 [Colletotrichum cuscutae]